jgi:hypothetical protein
MDHAPELTANLWPQSSARWEKAMEALYRRFPDDPDAAAL